MTWDGLLRELLALRPAALGAAGMTLVMFLALHLRLRKLEACGKGGKLAGLFVGLGGRSMLMLALAWLKLCILSSVLLQARPAAPGHYLLLLCLGAGLLLCRPAVSTLLAELVGGGALAAGMAVCGGLLDYLGQIRNDGAIRLAYWLLSVFMIFCAVGLFLREVTVTSGERTYFDETGEIE